MIQFVSNKVLLCLTRIPLGSAADACAKWTPGESVKYIYNKHVWFTDVQMFSVCSRYQSWPEVKGPEREGEKRCPLLKLRYTRQGDPSLQLQLWPKYTDVISNKTTVFQTPTLTNMAKASQHRFVWYTDLLLWIPHISNEPAEKIYPTLFSLIMKKKIPPIWHRTHVERIFSNAAL